MLRDENGFLLWQYGLGAKGAIVEVLADAVATMIVGALAGDAAQSEAIVDVTPGPMFQQAAGCDHSPSGHEAGAGHVFAQGH